VIDHARLDHLPDRLVHAAQRIGTQMSSTQAAPRGAVVEVVV
jgi:hypothetical protein